MNGPKVQIVIDTNILFMAWYNPLGKCADILRKAREGKINLFAPDSVKEEIKRVFLRKNLNETEIEGFLEDIPITWVDKTIYKKFLEKTKVKHKADKPIEAVSLLIDCGILSANFHFKNREEINRVLENCGKKLKLKSQTLNTSKTNLTAWKI